MRKFSVHAGAGLRIVKTGVLRFGVSVGKRPLVAYVVV
jgi:hypothetical protein